MTTNSNARKNKAARVQAEKIFHVTQQLELIDLRLLKSMSSLKLGAEIQNVANINQSITIRHMRDSGRDRIAFQFDLSLSGTSEKEEIIQIAALFGEAYSVKSDKTIPDDILKKFGELVGLNTVWPYWREFVQSITTRMNLPPLTLPLMRPSLLQSNGDAEKREASLKTTKRIRKSAN